MTTNQVLIDRLKRAKEVSIVSILKEQGFEITDTGNYYRCLSPLRSESLASFDINKRNGKWTDRGNGKKGDVVDLIMLTMNKTYGEALDYLLGDEKKQLPKFEPVVREKDSIEIVDNRPIRCRYLIDYLNERKILPFIAQRYLTELEIRFPYGKYPERTSTVLGFKNDSGGYELRNKFLKVCNSPKDVTTIKGNNHKITNVYEGFFSFMSHQQSTPSNSPVYDSVILNSLSFLPQMISFWDKEKQLNGYLDNDDAGDKATKLLEDSFCGFIDQRDSYADYNDLNDQLTGKKLKKIKSIKELLE